jgi:dienelactone hydrolase
VVLILAAGTAFGAGPPPPAIDHRPAAVAFVGEVASGATGKAVARFGAAMASAMSEAQLRATWAEVVHSNGAFVRTAGTRVLRAGPYETVLVRSEFARATLDVKVVFDADGKVGGLWLVPSAAASDYTAADAPPPAPPSPPAGVREVDVTVGADPWKLPGTLALPAGDGPFPALVLVHGSGPSDRDETVGAARPFRDLAWGLAGKGIAVLRYDKRTSVHAAQTVVLDKLTVKEEVIDDAVAAVALLAARPEIDGARIVVLGHSMGGSLIPRIAAAAPRPAGFVIMAGDTRPIEETLRIQAAYLRSLEPNPSDAGRANLDALDAAAAKIKALDKSSTGRVFGAPAGYYLDLRAYRPARLVASVKRPLLVLQGGRDYQVPSTELDVWKTALRGHRNATFQLYPELNHLFIAGTGQSTPGEYEIPGHVAPAVIDDIAAFVTGLPRAKTKK